MEMDYSDINGDNNLNQICRFCLSKNEQKLNLLFGAKYSNLHYWAKIMTGIDLKKNECLSTKICSNCVKRFQLIDDFRKQCLESNKYFLKTHRKFSVEFKFINKGDSLLQLQNLEEGSQSSSDNLQTKSIYLTKNKNSLFQSEEHVAIDDKTIQKKRESSNLEIEGPDDCDSDSVKSEDEISANDMEIKMPSDYDPDTVKSKSKASAYAGRIGEFVCEICGYKYRSCEYLNIHKNIKHNPNFKKLKCDICGKEFDFKQSLKIHKAYHNEPSCECSICRKKLHTKKELKTHMLIHSNIWKFKCEICSKLFRTSQNRRVHMRAVHSDVRPFQCDIGDCIKTFPENYLLNFHKKKYHRNEI